MDEINNLKEGYVISSMNNLFNIFNQIQSDKNLKKNLTTNENLNTKERTFSILNTNNLLSSTNNFISTTNNLISNNNILTSLPNVSKKKFLKKNKKNYNYFSFLIFICIFILILNQCFFWLFLFILSPQKNKSYCFNNLTKKFKICNNNDYLITNCFNIEGFKNYIFNEKIFIKEISKELEKINNDYLEFYIKESLLFSLLNHKYTKNMEIDNYFNIRIILIKNEKFLFNNTFRITCENTILHFTICFLIGMIFGNIILSMLSDIFGRKKIIIISILFEIFGGFLIVLLTLIILKKNKTKIYYENDEKLNYFIRNFNEKEFSNTNLNKVYEENYNNIKNEVLETFYIKKNFSKFGIFLYIGIIILFSGKSSLNSIILCYLMENSLTENNKNNNFLYFQSTFPLSLIITYFLLKICENFYFPIFLILLFLIVFFIFFVVFLKESQRFNFEYSLYNEITDFTENFIGKENLIKNNFLNNNIYYSSNNKKIKTELNFMAINSNINIFNFFSNEKSKTNKNLFKSKQNRIKKEFLIKNPFLIYNFIKQEKIIQKQFLIIFSFILSTSLVINISLCKITSNIFFSREFLQIHNKHFYIYILLYFIMLFPFTYYLIKYLGNFIILFFSLIIIILFSIIYEINSFFQSNSADINISPYNYIEKNNGILRFCGIVVLLFSINLIYGLYFYLTNLTKTIYRGTFYGLTQFIFDLTWVLSVVLDHYVQRSYFYLSLFGIIALTNNFIIINNEDTLLNINEFREIYFDEN